MNHSTKIAGGIVALMALTACGNGEPEPTPTVTVTETAEPEAAVDESDDDPWLTAMREDHLDDLFDWWADYYVADCDASESECYDIFKAGIDPMYEYAEDYRNAPDRPDYVSALAPNPYIAAETMESWSYACPDAGDCAERAEQAEERVMEVLLESTEWGD